MPLQQVLVKFGKSAIHTLKNIYSTKQGDLKEAKEVLDTYGQSKIYLRSDKQTKQISNKQQD